MQKNQFYTDPDRNFSKVLLYGLEWDLMTHLCWSFGLWYSSPPDAHFLASAVRHPPHSPQCGPATCALRQCHAPPIFFVPVVGVSALLFLLLLLLLLLLTHACSCSPRRYYCWGSSAVAAAVSYVLHLAIVWTRGHFGKQNISVKTMVPMRFLV